MKRYEVWAKCKHGSCDVVTLEFEDSDPEAFCEAACRDAIDTLGRCFDDTGFNLLEDGEEPIEVKP